jgi:hypothetical protein
VSEQQRSDARQLISAYRQAAIRWRAAGRSGGPAAKRLRAHHEVRRSTALRGLQAISPELATAVAVQGGIEDDLDHARDFSPPARVAELEAQQRVARGHTRRLLEFLSTIPEAAERTAELANPDDERTVTP